MPNIDQECRDCKINKPLTDFSPNPKRKSGVRGECRPCASLRALPWRDANRSKVLDAHLRRSFGITLEQYEALMQKQNGYCAICGVTGAPKAEQQRGQGLTTRLAVDHDHVTGEVRGLLCGPCNRALGLLRDDPAIIRSAARYLDGEG